VGSRCVVHLKASPTPPLTSPPHPLLHLIPPPPQHIYLLHEGCGVSGQSAIVTARESRPKRRHLYGASISIPTRFLFSPPHPSLNFLPCSSSIAEPPLYSQHPVFASSHPRTPPYALAACTPQHRAARTVTRTVTSTTVTSTRPRLVVVTVTQIVVRVTMDQVSLVRLALCMRWVHCANS
jgi:hypothetical protein